MGHIRLRVARVFLAGVVAGAAIAAGPFLAASQADADKAKIQERLVRIRADLFAGTTRADEAVRALKDILAVDPGSAEAHLLLGIAYRTVGAADLMGEAVAELRQALALEPGVRSGALLSGSHLSRSRPRRTGARRARVSARPDAQATLNS